MSREDKSISSINFKEFDKPELVEILEVLLKFNLLPSMEEYLLKKMTNSHFNRLTDERNKLVLKINSLLGKKRKSKIDNTEIYKLDKQIELKGRAREKSLIRLLNLKFIDEEKYLELTLTNK